MSKMSNQVKGNKKEVKGKVENFMGGYSYEWNPIDSLKMVTASSIFGEPQYYRDGEFADKKICDGRYHTNQCFKEYSVLPDKYEGKKTSDIMEMVIDEALSYDFKETLEWAVTLRKDYNMRLNPQVIMVRAAMHPAREEFTKNNPGLFAKINDLVMARADEPAAQLTYYLYKNKSKKNLPNLLKKSWNKKLSKMTAYQVNKYKNTGIGIIDTVRICHANSPVLDELLTTGKVEVKESEKTWETMRAAGESWRTILDTISMGHMALLRNLRGIFTEVEELEFCKKVMEQLKSGVKTGKQFPFRYNNAKQMIEKSNVNHKQMILDTLEECVDLACDNMPKLTGKTMCLSDNSGSAWSTFNSEYGSVTVATIGNLSSVITAKNSDEGYVGVFGDRLITMPVSKKEGTLEQTKKVNQKGKQVGTATENGIWLFFKQAIDNKEHWDNVVIYSDMQAGHGGLYGTGFDRKEYEKRGFAVDYRYIDVAKLIEEYRKINPKVNVYCVQTAGYNNVLIPEYGYRTGLLYGWTGKELLFIDEMNRFWDEKDQKN